MPIDKSKITNEMIKKAMECDTPDELIALAKTEGLAELEDFQLNSKALDKVAGGSCYDDCHNILCALF